LAERKPVREGSRKEPSIFAQIGIVCRAG
jgi:hypothetical protein